MYKTALFRKMRAKRLLKKHINKAFLNANLNLSDKAKEIHGKRRRHALMGGALGAAMGGAHAAYKGDDLGTAAMKGLAGAGLGAGAGVGQNVLRRNRAIGKSIPTMANDKDTAITYGLDLADYVYNRKNKKLDNLLHKMSPIDMEDLDFYREYNIHKRLDKTKDKLNRYRSAIQKNEKTYE